MTLGSFGISTEPGEISFNRKPVHDFQTIEIRVKEKIYSGFNHLAEYFTEDETHV